MTYYQSMGESQSDYKMEGNLCKPANFGALATFKRLQRNINRLSSLKKWALIGEDGEIGTATINAFNRLAGMADDFRKAGQAPTPGTLKGCDSLAINATFWANDLGFVADRLGAPTDPSAKPAKPVTVTGGAYVPPPPTGPAAPPDMMAMLTSPLGLGAMAVGGFLLIREDKKGRPRAGKRKAASKRRRAGRRRRR